MNSACFDFVMFSRGQHDEDNMSRRPWKRERSISTHHLNLSPNEDEELANCLVLLSNSGNAHDDNNNKHGHGKVKTVKKQKTAQVFQCKACKKVFASHQALGGHRASHKKVKGCFATQDKEEEDEEEYKEDDDDDEEDEDEEDDEDKSMVHVSRKRSNAHECTICHRVFSSGQALGGHKRCHWLTPSNYLRMTSLHHSVSRPQPLDQPSLDLNLACQDYSVDPTVMSVGMIQRDSGGDNHNATSSSWLKLASGDWS
ncbi:Zinc finger protein ZAT2 [Cardamine amara subsp. amara]|uniref:Zinc finger protein ZAT2 n=1 Tax=Cardamine amara subsp. amara TaxID=228776 RepID=A0ABD1BE04_CARAN